MEQTIVLNFAESIKGCWIDINEIIYINLDINKTCTVTMDRMPKYKLKN